MIFHTTQADIDELYLMLEKGELVPLSQVPALARVSPATRTRWLSLGLPALRIGGRYLSHPSAISKAMKKSGQDTKVAPAPAPEYSPHAMAMKDLERMGM